MPYPNEISRRTLATANGTPYVEVTINPYGLGDTTLVCIPDTPGNVLALCAHGYTGTEQTINATRMIETRDRFLDRGWIVASAYAHGDTWGNQTGQDDYVRVWEWVVENLATTATILHGQSMGALILALVYASGAITDARGLVSIDGALSLATAHASGSYVSSIRAAYGIAGHGSDYAALTAGHDPCVISAALFTGTRLLIESSPADTNIPKVSHSDVFVSHVTGEPLILSTLTGTGTHVDQANYFPAQVESFAASALLDPVTTGVFSTPLDFFINDLPAIALVPVGDVWRRAEARRFMLV